jgi:DNA-binding MarR family transcriptional regulator
VRDDQAAVVMAQTIKRARAALVQAVAERSGAEGRAGMRAAHAQVFEHLDLDGTRMTTLAERAQMSHQAMGELVGELVNSGYLERIPDPGDRRARLIRPTAQGRHELRRAADVLRDIRDRWQRELDAMPVDQVLAGLDKLIQICAPPHPSR